MMHIPFSILTITIMKQNSYEYITEQSQLIDFCSRNHKAASISVDTEFLRDKTYRPVFCLLQLSVDVDAVIIDPLANIDLNPIGSLLCNSSVIKIFHSGRQDIEILLGLWRDLSGPIFDTQIGASLIGLPFQLGYSDLIERLFGISIDKQHTRTVWTHRPLTTEQLRYAAADVLHLEAAYMALHSKLVSLNRLEWAIEDSNALLNQKLYESHPKHAWRKISGLVKVPYDKLPFLYRLAAWREITAQKRNLPRSWVLQDQTICLLAEASPCNSITIREILKADRYATSELALEITSAIHSPNLEVLSDESVPSPLLTTTQKSSLVRLMKLLHQRADELSLAPSVIASRKDFEQLLHKGPKHSRIMNGWRKNIIGDSCVRLLGT
jgi:ribonuclease D